MTVAGAEAVAAAADVIFAFGTSTVDTMDVEEHKTVTVVRLAYNLEQAIAEVALGLPMTLPAIRLPLCSVLVTMAAIRQCLGRR